MLVSLVLTITMIMTPVGTAGHATPASATATYQATHTATWGQGPCTRLKTQPGFWSRDGSSYTPPGRVLLRELQREGTAWGWVCRRLLRG